MKDNFLILWLVVSVWLFGGCVTAAKSMAEPITAAKDALQTSISIVSQESSLADGFEVKMVFENVSNKPLRVYYIDSPIFNTFQSRHFLIDENGKKYYISEEPHPHGYVVSQKDFHLIPAYERKVFTQKFDVLNLTIKPYRLNWIYENCIKRWEGGVRTLNGKTKSLFDDIDISYIWLGRIETTVEINE